MSYHLKSMGLRRNIFASICMIGIAMTNIAFAQTETPILTIASLYTGWNDDTFAIKTDSTILNPANCSTPDSYAANISSAGYKTHLAAALLAYASAKQLVVVISNSDCTSARPRIIGISLK
ncbi:MAG TPA: hypothetical protein VLA61_21365 [Ideonella sp.]|uniref:hypothetical protein n=1 Tax=Ideonella sp. TaxID=1929293 RepID=UPI002BE04EBD|nr:hypothetical protein [Ideonella sp.]HSI50824.1 hypothetical protein [Ideonella sp.]